MPNEMLDIESASILIVDDEEIDLDLLSALLSRNGFNNLTLFKDPRQAFEFYQSNKPDLILMSFMMPELNGLELLKLIQQEGHRPEN